jgi:hypothetical protein
LENLKGRDHSDDLGADGRIILAWKMGWEVVDWIHLAHERDRWWTLVNTIMNLGVK